LLIEGFSLSEQFGLEDSAEAVQKLKKSRSRSDRVGRLKYNQQLLKQTLAEVGEIKLMLRTIFAGLKDSFNFERSLLERVACADAVDREILQFLFEAGSPGLLPFELAARLTGFRMSRHQVSRRILRMNRRFEAEFGEHVAEKRGWHWALTGFAFESWGKFAEEVQARLDSR
jgi:hypothetical protein